jgi:DNA-binding SARP family transcriptional activator
MQRRIDVRHDPAGFPWARTPNARPRSADARDIRQTDPTGRASDDPPPTATCGAGHRDARPTAAATYLPGGGDSAEFVQVPTIGRGRDVASRERGEQAIEIRLFAEGRILARGEDITGLLQPCAREALYLIALHRYGIGRQRLCESLFPDIDPARRSHMLYSRTKIIRQVLRDAIGAPSAPVLRRELDGYRCDPRLVTVDVWQFNDALRGAGTARADDVRAASRLRAVELCGGRLLEDSGYLWAHAPRAELQHKAVTAVLWLAEHHNRRQESERAICLLEMAADIFGPHEEELYRQLLRLHAANGRIDTARRTYQLLDHRLSTIGVEPSDETRRLLQEVTGRPGR